MTTPLPLLRSMARKEVEHKQEVEDLNRRLKATLQEMAAVKDSREVCSRRNHRLDAPCSDPDCLKHTSSSPFLHRPIMFGPIKRTRVRRPI